MVQDTMHYESEIWNIADLLIAASVKQSDFPAYMMPFFAFTMWRRLKVSAPLPTPRNSRNYSWSKIADSMNTS